MSEHDDDRDLLAAELALRLLDGRDLDEARSLSERDADFAAAVAAWDASTGSAYEALSALALRLAQRGPAAR